MQTITMPKLGLTMTEGTISKWEKSLGDSVKEGDILFVVSTDKITYEVQAESSGTLASIMVAEGEDAPVAAPIAIIASEGEDISNIAEEKDIKEASVEKRENEEKRTSPSAKKVAVIGGGPGGYVCAIRLAQLGATVTMIEKEKMGGTCLNWGCIPTKVLVHTAEIYEETKKSSQIGLDIEGISINWASLMARKEAIVGQLVGGVEGLMAANGIEVIRGKASFLSPDTLSVEGKELHFDSIVIASGSETVTPPIPGVELESVVTSKEALSFDKIPRSMTIVGGGVIGMEFASLYSTMGTKVTVVEMLDRVLPMIDDEIAEVARKRMEEGGVKFYTSSRVTSFQADPENITTRIETPEGPLEISSEKVLLSVGRKPSTASLKVEKAGIKTDRSRIIVDDKMSTSVDGIYAIGDCSSPIQLAHVASAEGEVAAENIMGHDRKIDYKTVPSCVYTMPEIASVGLTEKEAKAKGLSVEIGKFPLSSNGKSLIMNDFDGFIKFVVDKKYDEILGVHIAGPRATDLIVEGALALRLEATVEEVVTTIHAHPTVGEALAEAALSAKGIAIHMPPQK